MPEKTKNNDRSRTGVWHGYPLPLILRGLLCAGCLYACLALLSACGDDRPAATPDAKPTPGQAAQQPSEVRRDSRLQRIKVASVPLFVETAQTEAERQRGLMYREHLPGDQGMLFVFPASQIQSFWMRNTFIPLDIAFISSDGIIVDIQHMKPVDESVLYTPRAPALYALEVNAGWFAQHGIEVGARVNF